MSERDGEGSAAQGRQALTTRIGAWMRARTALSHLRLLAAGAALFIIAVAVGAAAGNYIDRNDVIASISGKIKVRTDKLARRFGWTDDVQTIVWTPTDTNLITIEMAHIQAAPPAVTLSAVEEVGGNLIFMSRHGRFGMLTPDHALRPVEMEAPLALDALRESGNWTDPTFFGTYGQNEFGTFDMLAVETGPGRYDLFVSHHRYYGECIALVLSKISIEASPGVVRPSAEGWRDVFTARPCVDITPTGWIFTGHQTAGRIVQRDAETLLLSIGDFVFDGVHNGGNGALGADRPAVSMREDTDMGKIVEIDIATGQSRFFAIGLRNPQGLMIARDGRIWESEHGPQGGDEINLIREGVNYGWPNATYGMNYGFPRTDWPTNSAQGRHNGYELPRFAFVPSVGVSNLVEPAPEEFPLWSGRLLLSALKQRSLFLLNVEGDAITYAEPIPIPRQRLRDMINLRDGRIAIVTDSGALILIRNAERRTQEPDSFEVTGYDAFVAAFAPDADTIMFGGSAGAVVFVDNCAACHSLTGQPGVGPPLNDLVGRRVGGFPGYGYSPALRDHGGTWSRELIISFLTDPDERFAGTTMTRTAISRDQASSVSGYLESLRSAEAERP